VYRSRVILGKRGVEAFDNDAKYFASFRDHVHPWIVIVEKSFPGAIGISMVVEFTS
jgi:hypothetical protein